MSVAASLQGSSGRRGVLVVLVLIVFLSLLFTFSQDSVRQVATRLRLVPEETLLLDHSTPYKANATFVMLCKNDELHGVLSSIRQIEDRFNHDHGYPWVLLNDQPFDKEFKQRVTVLTNSAVFFGHIAADVWNQPDFIDEERARAGRAKLHDLGIIYADSISYRNMCRFNSGFFYRHPLLTPYRYYWRVEPNVDYFCNVNYDPFEFMERNNKTYGFTISLLEWWQTIPTLWDSVVEFMRENPQYIHPDNALAFVSNDAGKTYNSCHFWSNFEIADMDFWRGEAYSKFFEHLERKGGFYYERWGDAPVHSIAVSLLAPKNSIHYFYDIGYRHESFQHCPSSTTWQEGHCSCDPNETFNSLSSSCTEKFMVIQR